jgi:MFS family permease
MMFLQFFIAGAFTPVFSLYLIRNLQFSGAQTGLVLSLTSIGSIIAPLFTAYVADRFLRAEHLLGICNLAGGALIFAFSRQHSFVPATALYLAFTCIHVPTFALINAVVFHHSPGTRHRFGLIRVWGTIGWIAVAWVLGALWLRNSGTLAASRLPDVFTVAALSSVIAGLYAFTLPAGRTVEKSGDSFLPMYALRLFKNTKVLRLCLFMLAVTVIDRFYYFGTAPFLRSIGFPERNIMPAMSLGQVPEIIGMFLLGWLLLKTGARKVIAAGILFDLFRYAACALGGPDWLIISGLAVHGLAYTFMYTTAAIYLDSFCDASSRTGAHQLFSMLTSGIGSFSGNLLVGATLDWCAASGAGVNYHAFWLAPAASIAALLVLFPVLLPAIHIAGKK